MLSEKMESLKSYLEDERNFMELVDLIEEIFWETVPLKGLNKVIIMQLYTRVCI